MRLSNWMRRPQERTGKHRFSGTMYVTQGVNAKLTPAEIIIICLDIRRFITEIGGADYFQVYENEKGDKLYFIDCGSPEMQSAENTSEDNHCVLMFSDEY